MVADPEFSLDYNDYSMVIPLVEYYLYSSMDKVRTAHGAHVPELKHVIDLPIKQEINHSRYYVRFNKHMYEAGFEGLQALVGEVTADLKRLRETRSLTFSVAYCAGFESIATYDAKYLYYGGDLSLQHSAPITDIFVVENGLIRLLRRQRVPGHGRRSGVKHG